jgi:hypothetical protein
MFDNPFMAAYLVMLFFQTLHIFEEIRFEVYEEIGSLNKYLMVASFLVFLYYFPLFVILLKYNWGYYVAFLPAILAIGNGIAHVYGMIKHRKQRGPIAGGVFSGVFLAFSGIAVLINIFNAL